MAHISRTAQMNFYDQALKTPFDGMAESYSGEILENAVEFISANFDPEEIFSEDQLTRWAKENGFGEEE